MDPDEQPRERRPPGRCPGGGSIRVLHGFYEGLEMPVDRDWMVIGRGRGADIVIAEPTMSRAHAAIGYDGATSSSRTSAARTARA